MSSKNSTPLPIGQARHDKLLVRCLLPDESFVTVPLKADQVVGELKSVIYGKASKKGLVLKELSEYVLRLMGSHFCLGEEELPLTFTQLIEKMPFEISLVEKSSIAEERRFKRLNERVYLCFTVAKQAQGEWLERIFHFDFQDKVLDEVDKEDIVASTPFDKIKSFAIGDEDTNFAITFTDSQPMFCRTHTKDDRDFMLQCLTKVAHGNLSQQYKAGFFTTILKSGFVDKKVKAAWHKRYLILVPRKLFCFADSTGVAFPRNVMALEKESVFMNNGEFTVTQPTGYTFTFRPSKKEEVNLWMTAFMEALNAKDRAESGKGLILKQRPGAWHKEENGDEKTGDKEDGENEPAQEEANVNSRGYDVGSRTVMNMKVFWNFAVFEGTGLKSTSSGASGSASLRTYAEVNSIIMNFDMEEKVLKLVAKERIKRQIPFSDVANFNMSQSDPLSFSIVFKPAQTLHFSAQTVTEREIVCSVIFRVIEDELGGLNDNEPRLILKSGYIEKKERQGWKRRYLMLVPWKLYVFAKAKGVIFPRNVVSLYGAKIADKQDYCVVELDDYKLIFRTHSSTNTQNWAKALNNAASFNIAEFATAKDDDRSSLGHDQGSRVSPESESKSAVEEEKNRDETSVGSEEAKGDQSGGESSTSAVAEPAEQELEPHTEEDVGEMLNRDVSAGEENTTNEVVKPMASSEIKPSEEVEETSEDVGKLTLEEGEEETPVEEAIPGVSNAEMINETTETAPTAIVASQGTDEVVEEGDQVEEELRRVERAEKDAQEITRRESAALPPAFVADEAGEEETAVPTIAATGIPEVEYAASGEIQSHDGEVVVSDSEGEEEDDDNEENLLSSEATNLAETIAVAEKAARGENPLGFWREKFAAKVSSTRNFWKDLESKGAQVPQYFKK